MAATSPIGLDARLRDVPFPRFEVAVAVAALLVLLTAGSLQQHRGAATPDAATKIPDSWGQREAAAAAVAAAGPGTVSFAVIDAGGNVVAAHNAANPVSAASTLKAMILAAYLRQSDVAARELTSAEQASLTQMITWSSNDDATRLLRSAGWAAMDDVAAAAGMLGGYTPDHEHWGLTQMSAGSMARLFHDLPALIPAQHREFALGLFADVVDSQQWGMPAATREEWQWHIKGGWIDEAVSQLGTFTRGDQEFTVAITVEGGPGTGGSVSADPESVPAVKSIEHVTAAIFGPGGIPEEALSAGQSCAAAAPASWSCSAPSAATASGES